MKKLTPARLPRTAWLLPALLSFALAGCSSFSLNDLIKGEKIDYKSAGKVPPLEIPPDLTTSRDDRFSLPKSVSALEVAAKDTAAPRNATLLPNVPGMRIEVQGQQRWLVVDKKPEELWPAIKDFWQEMGFIVRVEVPEAGVMETDWAENRAKIPLDFIRNTLGNLLDTLYSTSERDRFRTRLEPSANGGTEIYVSHRGMIEVYTSQQKDSTAWQPRPSDAGLEAEFLRRMMVRFGSEDAVAKAQVAARPAQERAKRSGSFVVVDEPFDRAWRQVGLVLDRVGFTVEDRDRSRGLYFVRYQEPETEVSRKKEDKGFLGRLLDFGSSSKARQAEKYQIQVKGESNSTQVAVLGENGGTANPQTANRILGLLHEQLK
jgi:outer membrane protein assembly factor BamC